MSRTSSAFFWEAWFTKNGEVEKEEEEVEKEEEEEEKEEEIKEEEEEVESEWVYFYWACY